MPCDNYANYYCWVKTCIHAYLEEVGAWKNKDPAVKELWNQQYLRFFRCSPVNRPGWLLFPSCSPVVLHFTVCALTKSAGGFVVSVAWLKGVYPDAVNHSGSAALLITGQTRRSQAHMVHTYGLCMFGPRPSLNEVGCSEEWVVASVYFQGVHPDSQNISNTQHTLTQTLRATLSYLFGLLCCDNYYKCDS